RISDCRDCHAEEHSLANIAKRGLWTVVVRFFQQETITNALTHGRAKNVTVTLDGNNNELELRIQNDGLSISESASTSKGMRLRIMQHRARLINANLTIKPADGGDTVVTCVLSRGESK